MENILSILIVEDDKSAANELKNEIAKHDNLRLVDVTSNSSDALRLVRFHLPNVVILDLELHHGGGNGLIFLNELKKMPIDHSPFILITTHNMSDVTLEQARELGADWTLAKYEAGYCASYVIENIFLLWTAIIKKNTAISPWPDITPAEREQLIEKRIHRELDLIGINPKVKGYTYLKEAIMLVMDGTTDEFTRIIAQRHSKSQKSVERAMQNCIKTAWTNTPPDDLLKYYTAKITSSTLVPSMMELVFHYARMIEVDMRLIPRR